MKARLRGLLLLVALLLAACGAPDGDGTGPPSPTAPLVEEPAAPLSRPAGTWHVSPAGKDGNDGTASAPWRTLQHAADQAIPGDTIRVLEGNYDGLRIERSGTDGAWITLQAARGARVVIDAPGPNNRHRSNIEVETWEGNGVVAYWIIEGLEVSNAPAWGIDLRGSEEAKAHRFVVRHNRVHHNGLDERKTGIFAAFVDDLLVEENESYSNGEHGVYISNSSDRFTVRGNRLHDNPGCGLHLNGDVEQGGDGVLSDGLVEGNIIYGNGAEGGAAINMDGVVDTVVRNNLLYDNHASGIALYQENGAVCSRNNQVLHNTVLMPDDGRWAVILGQADCTGNTILNNILYSEHSYRGSINLPARRVKGLVSDYNLLVDRLTTDDSESVIPLDEWRALGLDTHSEVAGAAGLFVDLTSHDYHLGPGSLAIDAGADQPGTTTDLEGNPRPAGAGWDAGAFEYGG